MNSAASESYEATPAKAERQLVPVRNYHLFAPHDEDYWLASRAYDVLTTELLLPLAAVFAGLSVEGLQASSWTQLEHLGVRPDDEISGLGLRELLLLLQRPGARPQNILNLLKRRLPLSLPSDPSEAAKRLLERLDAAIPSSDTGARIVKTLLAEALGGWWHGSMTVEFPLGWRRAAAGSSMDGKWKRAVPSLTSKAWQLWPQAASFMTPAKSLLLEPSPHPLLSQALGLTVSVPRASWWTTPEQPTLDDVLEDDLPDEDDPSDNTSSEDAIGDNGIGDNGIGDNGIGEGSASDEALGEDTQHDGDNDPAVLPLMAHILTGSISTWLSDPTADNPTPSNRRGKSRSCGMCGHAPGMHQCCGRCGQKADGEIAVATVFGFRSMRNKRGETYAVPQPWCRDCRAGQRKAQGSERRRGET